MRHHGHQSGSSLLLGRALVVIGLLAALLVAAPFDTPQAQAQSGVEPLDVWGISGGIVSNPKQWKYRASTSSGNDLGSASAASPSLDDSGWQNVNLRWREFPGSNVANHFRKDFTLDEIGVEAFQIVGIRVSLQYDDTAVMYLNGVEVYRSIRGNLDPDYSPYALGENIPFDVNVPWGGAENDYVDIPNVNGTNTCEIPNRWCSESPYDPNRNPPEIPVDLLNEDGVNTWAITVWNQSNGGSGDVSVNHTFQLLIDEDALPPNPIVINEVMASNDSSYGVNIDDDPQLEYPDWFELRNISSEPVNLQGWTISDSAFSWVFPSVVVPANGYLVVAASDNDRTDTTPLQTNFKLSAGGESLKLTNPGGFVADEYAVIPQQFEDNAYGRPNDSGDPTYLLTPTPGSTNSGAGDGYDPILRLFPNRLYNVGESVNQQIDAFDPDGDTLGYSMSPMPPGLSMTPQGLITGTLNQAGTFTATITVTDSDNDSASQLVVWTVFPAVGGPVPIVMNEYNAVAEDSELIAGSALGNGGDWYEFVVVQDGLDLRGYSFELYDLKGPDDQLRLASIVRFGNDDRLAQAPAGTILTVSQENPDDLDFDGDTDWHINFQITNDANGAFFVPASPGWIFNSTRTNQTVLIKDASGVVVTPLAGESEAWDEANGGVNESEVMSLCIDPTPGMSLDPVTAYRDNGLDSSFGEPNTCIYPDPNDQNSTITFVQDLSALRGSADLGVYSGDVNCDRILDIGDAMLVAQYSVLTRTDSGPCAFESVGQNDIHGAAADFDRDGEITIADAMLIARCSVGLPNEWCPE